jgi:hypothetical protein
MIFWTIFYYLHHCEQLGLKEGFYLRSRNEEMTKMAISSSFYFIQKRFSGTDENIGLGEQHVC